MPSRNLNIYPWLEQRLGPVHIKTHGIMFVNCPFCGDANHHLSVSTTKQVWNCFRCNTSGTYHTLIQRVDGVSFGQAFDILRNPSKLDNSSIAERVAEIIDDKIGANKEDINPVTEMPDWYCPFIGSSNVIARNAIVNGIFKYATKRVGVDGVIVMQLGFCDDPDQRYFTRLIIPIEDGYFQARDITGFKRNKYLNPDMEIEHRLYNPTALEIFEEIYITEGAFDAYKLGPNAVATLGSGIKMEQAERIASKVNKVIFTPDADKKYAKSSTDAMDYFYEHGIEVDIALYEQGDPDEGGEYVQVEYDLHHKVYSIFRR